MCCYLHDMRDSHQEGSNAHNQHQYLLHLEVLQDWLAVAVHQTGHHDFHHSKLQSGSTCQHLTRSTIKTIKWNNSWRCCGTNVSGDPGLSPVQVISQSGPHPHPPLVSCHYFTILSVTKAKQAKIPKNKYMTKNNALCCFPLCHMFCWK